MARRCSDDILRVRRNTNTWTCQISRRGRLCGPHHLNPDRTDSIFSVPRNWGASQVKALAGGQRGISGGSFVEVGPTPVLLDNQAK